MFVCISLVLERQQTYNRPSAFKPKQVKTAAATKATLPPPDNEKEYHPGHVPSSSANNHHSLFGVHPHIVFGSWDPTGQLSKADFHRRFCVERAAFRDLANISY